MEFKFRDKKRGKRLARLIQRDAPPRELRLVHVCGTHEITITENGLRSFLPSRVQILEGPGCPVCVTPTQDLDAALKLADKGIIVAAFGDMMRVPGTERSLEQARSDGADVRLVYSVNDAVELARNQDKDVVFLGVGFETTAPMTAAALESDPPKNFSVLVANKLIPPAMEALLNFDDMRIDAFIAPGHVSTIIGGLPYEPLVEEFDVPIVVAGFEPLDMLYAINLILNQIKEGTARVENAYPRAVDFEGNKKALDLLEKVFEVVDVNWRGIGLIEQSGLKLRDKYSSWDARKKYGLEGESQEDVLSNCLCPQILTARATPDQCELFGEQCTPSRPYGPCMVGEEAMCNIWYRYGGRPKL